MADVLGRSMDGRSGTICKVTVFISDVYTQRISYSVPILTYLLTYLLATRIAVT